MKQKMFAHFASLKVCVHFLLMNMNCYAEKGAIREIDSVQILPFGKICMTTCTYLGVAAIVGIGRDSICSIDNSATE